MYRRQFEQNPAERYRQQNVQRDLFSRDLRIAAQREPFASNLRAGAHSFVPREPIPEGVMPPPVPPPGMPGAPSEPPDPA